MESIQPYKKWLIGTVLVLYVALIGYKLLSETPEEAYQTLIDERRESVSASIEKLSIADPNLLACIKKAALKYGSVGPMSSGGIDSVSELKTLYCRQKNIQSLRGLESLTQLVFLNLSNNRIEDITPLASSTQLKTLHLSGNPLTEITALKEHTLLESVSLPKMPNTDCNEIKTTLQKATQLRLPPCKQSRNRSLALSDRKAKNKAEALIKESRQLSQKEESELLDYEYELLRRID